jgi:hypothetical protein
MAAVVQAWGRAVHRAQVGLMDEVGGVERACSPLGLQSLMGELTQAIVDDGDELIQGTRIALPPASEEAGDLERG